MAIHQRIHDDLKAQILAGHYPSGALLPSKTELAEDWNCSPASAAKALALLVAGKLAVSKPRIGTVVADVPRLIYGPQQRRPFTHWAAPDSVIVTDAAYLPDAPEYVRAILDLDHVREDLWPVIRREEVWYDPASTPYMLLVEWVRPSRGVAEDCPLLAEPQPLMAFGGSIAVIEQNTAHVAVRVRQSEEARWPLDDGREMPLLRLDFHDAVLAHVTVWYDALDVPLVYEERTVIPNRVIETEGTA